MYYTKKNKVRLIELDSIVVYSYSFCTAVQMFDSSSSYISCGTSGLEQTQMHTCLSSRGQVESLELSTTMTFGFFLSTILRVCCFFFPLQRVVANQCFRLHLNGIYSSKAISQFQANAMKSSNKVHKELSALNKNKHDSAVVFCRLPDRGKLNPY